MSTNPTIKAKPRVPVNYNENLPSFVREAVPGETEQLWASARKGFEYLLVTHDLYPGAAQWIGAINTGLDFKFELSKEDRKAFVLMAYEIALLEDIDSSLQTKLFNLLTRLTKKQQCDDLVIPWRPLYDLVVKMYYPNSRCFRTFNVANHSKALLSFITVARDYWAPGATEEMLAEWRPMLCPFDSKFQEGFAFYCVFLTTKGDGWKLWFDEMLAFWDEHTLSAAYNKAQTNLMANLAEAQKGKIDWRPHLPGFFSRFLAMVNVPVNKVAHAEHQYASKSSIMMAGRGLDRSSSLFSHAARFIVHTIQPGGPGESAGGDSMMHLQRLILCLESYFHPANGGYWSARLGELLQALMESYVSRVGEERQPDCETPQELRLTPEITEAYIRMLLPVIQLSLHSKTPRLVQGAVAGIKQLAHIAPEVIIPPLLEGVYPALTTLMETHRTLAALEVLGGLARPMFTYANYPEGVKHLQSLLQLTVPGVDANDPMKTCATVKFYIGVLSCVPLIDCTENGPAPDSLNEIEQAAYSGTGIFSDWVVTLLENVFSIFKQAAPTTGKSKTSKFEDAVTAFLDSAMAHLFSQMSENIFKLALQHLFTFVSENLMINAIDQIGALVSSCCYARSELALARFVPYCTEAALDEIASGAGAAGHADARLQWHLRMLGEAFKCANGRALLPYRDDIIRLLTAAFPLTSKDVAKATGKIFRNTIRALTYIYMIENRSHPTEMWNSKEFQRTHFRHWGEVFQSGAETAFQWHTPSEEEVDMARAVMEVGLNPAMERLRAMVDTKDAAVPKDQIFRDLLVIRNVLRSTPFLLSEWLDPETAARSDDAGNVFARSFPGCSVQAPYELPLTPVPPKMPIADANGETRRRIGDLLHDLKGYVLESREDDTVALRQIAKAMYQLLNNRGMLFEKYSARKKTWELFKKLYESNAHPGEKSLPRYTVWTRTAHLYSLRLTQRVQRAPLNALYRSIFHDLYDLSVSHYSIVRKKAQVLLRNSFRRCAPEADSVVRKAIALLDKNNGTQDFQVTAAVYLLSAPEFASRVHGKVKLTKEFYLAFCQSDHMEKSSVIARLKALIENYAATNRTLQFRLPPPPDRAGVKERFPGIDWALKELSEEQVNKVHAHKQSEWDAFHAEGNAGLLALAADPKLHWKYCYYIASCLYHLVRDDKAPTTAVTQYFVDTMVCEVPQAREIALRGLSHLLGVMKFKQPRTYSKDENFPNGKKFLGPGDWATMEVPRNKEEYDATVWIDKNYIGWNGRPPLLKIYGPPVDDILSQDPPDVAASKAIILKAFMNPEYVKKHIHFTQDIERTGKGEDFDDNRAKLYKGLFQTFRDVFLPNFVPELDRLVHADVRHERGYQSTASEVVAGLVRGSKHWPYEKVVAMWGWLVPFLREVFVNAAPDAMNEWRQAMVFFAADWDPRRLTHLTDALFDQPLSRGNSLAQSKALAFTLPLLSEFSWRGARYWFPLLSHVMQHFATPYHQVRDRIANMVSKVIRFSAKRERDPVTNLVVCTNVTQPLHPNIVGFLDGALNKIQELKAIKEQTDAEREMCGNLRKSLLYTVYYTYAGGAATGGCFSPFVHKILPELFALQEDADPQIVAAAKMATQLCSVAQYPPDTLKQLLHFPESVMKEERWQLRKGVLPFLQLLMFRHIFLMPPEEVTYLANFLLSCLEDTHVEVREMASVSLSGLMKVTDRELMSTLQERFRELSRTKLVRKRPLTPGQTRVAEDIDIPLIKRHAGVLGLAAIVGAFPYDVPDWLPPVLSELAGHIGDPSPISKTVKTVVSDFWRTHKDTFEQYESLFSEDQLDLVKSLLVSKNYYA